jgi:hypothetical protein
MFFNLTFVRISNFYRVDEYSVIELRLIRLINATPAYTIIPEFFLVFTSYRYPIKQSNKINSPLILIINGIMGLFKINMSCSYTQRN